MIDVISKNLCLALNLYSGCAGVGGEVWCAASTSGPRVTSRAGPAPLLQFADTMGLSGAALTPHWPATLLTCDDPAGKQIYFAPTIPKYTRISVYELL